MKRFNSLLADLLNLAPHATPCEEIEETTGNATVRHKFTDESVWNNFATKWRLPGSTNYSSLLAITRKSTLPVKWDNVMLTWMVTEETFSTMSKSPCPQFQRLCLVDLPVELLDIILGYTTIEQGRLLSATCRVLHQIGARHIHEVCTIYNDP
jgi:hypothetical protein